MYSLKSTTQQYPKYSDNVGRNLKLKCEWEFKLP